MQRAINDATNKKIFLPGGTLVITQAINIPSNFTIEGKGTILINKTNDYALKIIGREGFATTITQDIVPGGGVPNINPTVTVRDVGMFQAGDYVKFIKDNTFPLRIEFNIIKSIAGNTLTFKKRFLQPFLQKDNIKITQFHPKENVAINNLEITSTPQYQAYGVYAKNTKMLSLSNVTFKNLARKPIYIEHSYMPEVLNSQFIENGSPGMGDYGIGSVQNMGVTINGNKLLMSGAIYLKGNVGAVVSNNQSESPGITGGDGISILSTFYSLFESNVFMVANCYGIWMNHESEHNIISNNQFFSGITSGIYLTENAKNNIITNNIFDKNFGNGIFIDFTANNNSIEKNSITNNNGRGILVHGSDNIIRSNLSMNNGLENIRVVPNMGNIINDNVTN